MRSPDRRVRPLVALRVATALVPEAGLAQPPGPAGIDAAPLNTQSIADIACCPRFHPMVAAQHYAYLLRELNLVRDERRGNSDPEMVRVIKPYPPDDLKILADYTAQLPPPKR